MLLDVNRCIAAIASPPGQSPRGVVRVSGQDIVGCLTQCFRPNDQEFDWAQVQRPALVGGVMTVAPPLSRIAVDLAFWPNSRSYTRQPCAEIHCPGAPPILDSILEALFQSGIRPAEPGEFTLRAFLAGRIDLTQAEAVVGLIDAQSRDEMEVALRQLSGGLAGPVEQLREALLALLAEIEAGLDFVEEDIEFVTSQQILKSLSACRQQLADLLEQIDFRQSHQRLMRVVLYGRPNVGKSRLLNALAESRKSLVSDREGTTRDYVTGVVCQDGVTVELVDTAGLDSSILLGKKDSTGDVGIESLAQTVTEEKQESAHLRLLCLDGSRPLDDWERSQLANPGSQLCIQTKSDLPPAWQSPDCCAVSAATGAGIEFLRHRIFHLLAANEWSGSHLVGNTAARCQESLLRASADLQAAVDYANCGSGEEIIAAQIRAALDELAVVTGRVYTDDILDRIFSQFCIGK